MLAEAFEFLWVGFYKVDGKRLSVGPYQGPLCCSHIDYGKGVCGKAWEEKRVLVVADVSEFKGHIACSSRSRSEIVVPIIKNNHVIAVLDIDSEKVGCFDSTDALYLEKLSTILACLATP